MNMQLLLLGLSILIWGEGVVLRRRKMHWLFYLVGWLLSALAVWIVIVAVGAWPPLWPVPLVALLGAWLHFRQQNHFTVKFIPIMANVLLVLIAGLFSLPPLDWRVLLITAVLLPTTAFILDTFISWIIQRIPWQTIAVSGLLPLIVLFAVPDTRGGTLRLFSTRFAYLLPEAHLTTDPTPTSQRAIPTSQPTSPLQSTEVPSSPTPLATARPTLTPPIVATEPTSELDATGVQWSPYIEWELPNPSYQGNPYDLMATATFIHTESGESRTTGLFYAGNDAWRFRFIGVRAGVWTFTTSSDDPDLDGLSGTVTIEPNPKAPGFISNDGNKWIRTNSGKAFVPQLVMIGGPQTYYNNPAEIQNNIQTFLVQHGFNGVHTPVFCRWFDIEQRQCSRVNVADPNPDPRTFEALEALIMEVNAAGGMVHIWMWGDDSRSENVKRWGINGEADKRLQRYIAARLGPLPGWTIGYGYDLFEWVTGEQLTEWHDYMQSHLGWTHSLGARANKNQLDQLSEMMDYSSYEQHRPDYAKYVEAIEARPEKAVFSEDRFRIGNDHPYKDYDMEMTRRGLWHSTMAGGVANIWGNLVGAAGANVGTTTSAPYPDPDSIKTYALFFENRFLRDMVRCNELTDGRCLKRPTNTHYIFYKEDTTSLQMDLSEMVGEQTAVAVDTRLPYVEIDLGALNTTNQIWTAPYESDWAIAVGDFDITQKP